MRDIAEFLGWIVAWGFGIAMLNFVLKFIYKKYIVKLQKDKNKAVDAYRLIMKYVVKYHKLIGTITALAVIIHFVLMLLFVKVSITGLASMLVMLCIFSLGIYGAYFNKNYKGKWLKIHRLLAFLLVIMIGLHII